MTTETAGIVVRPARPDDAAQAARVHVESWRETYRGLFPDEVLDDPGFPARRERLWTAVTTDPRYADRRAAVAEVDGEVVGIALAGPAEDEDASWPSQLYVIYLLRRAHGSGAGAALLDAVLDPAEDAALWVADPNPRAQAFYRRHGFAPDGTAKVEGGVREIRMVRAAAG